jgi:2-oxoglutarate ferredoxin oxidoreductase subunit gamma
MAVLGGYLKMKPVVAMENVEKGLAKSIPARYSDLIALNKAAIEEGMNSVETIG